MDFVNLNSFLKFGYFMKYEIENYKLDFSNIDKSKYEGLSKHELIKIGQEKLLRSIESDFETGKKHVVPISGGLDSRGILGGLLEFTEAKNISTYTFGTPGSLDYDIGNYVANKTGTNHLTFDLKNFSITEDELINVSNRVRNQTVLFQHPPVWELDKIYGGSNIWSGFAGDGIVGGHLPSSKSNDINQAKRRYISDNDQVKSMNLSDVDDKKFAELINFNLIPNSQMCYEEQIYFNERLKKYIAPHVLIDGFQYKIPFINPNFADFLLSVNDCFRINKSLFKDILLHSFPKLFSLKTKTNYGASLGAHRGKVILKRLENSTKRVIAKRYGYFVNPYLNYIDFNSGIREREDLRSVIYKSIHDLKGRKIIDWLDLEEIYNTHMRGEKELSDVLIVLASLEIHLKASDKK